MEITINGLKTHYQVFGTGQPFLILHGWGSNRTRWTEVAELLAKHNFKVIVPDLPGFGESDVLEQPWTMNNYVNWTDEFIKQMNMSDFYLMGHSFGGGLASKIIMKHSQDVKKLFLVSAAVVRTKTATKSASATFAKVVKLFSFLPFYPLFRKAVYKFILRRSDYAYVEGVMKETYLNVIKENLSFHLSFIKVPTVIIWGGKDDFTPIEDAHFINEHIKNSKLEIIPGAAHDLNRKQPEILAEKILKNI